MASPDMGLSLDYTKKNMGVIPQYMGAFGNGGEVANDEDTGFTPANVPLGLTNDIMDAPIDDGNAPSVPAPDQQGSSFADNVGKIGQIIEAVGAGYHSREPLFMKLEQQQLVDKQRMAMVQARQQQQIQQRRIAEANQAIKIAMDDKMPHSTKIKMLENQGTDHARGIAQVLTKDFAANGKAYEEHLSPRGQALLQQWYQDPKSVPMADLESEFDLAKDQYKQTAKDRAEASMISGLDRKFKQDPNSLTAGELEIYKKHHDEQDKRAAILQELQAKNRITQATEPAQVQEARAKATSAAVKSRVDVATEYAQANKIKAEAGKAAGPVVSPMFVVDDQGTVAHYVTDKDGNTKMVLGKPIQRTQDMSSAMLGKRAELVALKRQTEDLWDKFKDEYAGRWDAIRMGLQGATNTLPPDAAAFVTSWDTYVKALRKEALGTAQSARELSTNKYAFPELSQGETVIREFMKNQHKQIVNKLQAQRDVVDESRRKDPPMASARLQQLKSMAPLLYKTKAEAEQAIGEIMADELSRGLLVDDHGK